MRTSRCWASSSAGGRVWGVTSSSCSVGPMVRASRIITQPVGVFQVVSRMLVPGSYTREVGTLIPKGPKRKAPAWRSSRVPKMLGESNRGTHSQSIAPSGATRAPVWQFERKAYSAIGGNGEGAAALCGCSDGLTSRPTARASRRTRRPGHRLPPVPNCPERTDGGSAALSSSGCMIRQACSTLSWRVNRAAVAVHRGEQQHLVRARPLATLGGKLHLELDLVGRDRLALLRVDLNLIPVLGSSLITSWFDSGRS